MSAVSPTNLYLSLFILLTIAPMAEALALSPQALSHREYQHPRQWDHIWGWATKSVKVS
jgi:hypothetical protein